MKKQENIENKIIEEEQELKKLYQDKQVIKNQNESKNWHEKLYKEAESKENKLHQLKEEYEKQIYTFKPQLFPNSEEINKKVQQKRKPLYQQNKESFETKNQNYDDDSAIIEEQEGQDYQKQKKQQKKNFSIDNFEEFLERNYQLERKKFERDNQKKQNQENLHKNQEIYTFKPQINKVTDMLSKISKQNNFQATNQNLLKSFKFDEEIVSKLYEEKQEIIKTKEIFQNSSKFNETNSKNNLKNSQTILQEDAIYCSKKKINKNDKTQSVFQGLYEKYLDISENKQKINNQQNDIIVSELDISNFVISQDNQNYKSPLKQKKQDWDTNFYQKSNFSQKSQSKNHNSNKKDKSIKKPIKFDSQLHYLRKIVENQLKEKQKQGKQQVNDWIQQLNKENKNKELDILEQIFKQQLENSVDDIDQQNINNNFNQSEADFTNFRKASGNTQFQMEKSIILTTPVKNYQKLDLMEQFNNIEDQLGKVDQRQRAQSEIEVSCFQNKNFGNSQILNKQNSTPIRQKQGEIEGYEAIQQQKIEQLEKQLKDQKKFVSVLQEKLQQSQKQNQNLNNQLTKTEEALVQSKIEISELKEIQDNNYLTIQQLSEENKQFIDKIQAEKIKYENLCSRMVYEKQQMVDKQNFLNKEEEELMLKLSMLQEKEKHFQSQKNQFHKNVQQSGQTDKLPSLAPKMSQNQADIIQDSVGAPVNIYKRKMKFHQSEIYSIVTSTNGNLVATCSGDRFIQVYDPFNDVMVAKIQGYRASQIYTDIAFSPFNHYLLAGTTDNIVQIFSFNPDRKLADFLGHSQKINSVQFVSDKTKFVSSSEDKTIKLWDVTKKQIIKSVSGSNCRTIAGFTQEPHIVTGHDNGGIKMYSIKEGKLIYDIQEVFEEPITNIKLTNCGNKIIASSTDGDSIKVLDVRQTKQILHQLQSKNYSNTHEYNKITLGPAEQWVIGGSSGGSIHLWDILTNQKNNKIIQNTQHEGTVICADFHSGSGFLYTGDKKGNFFIWN